MMFDGGCWFWGFVVKGRLDVVGLVGVCEVVGVGEIVWRTW